MTDIEYIAPDEVYPMWSKAVERVRDRFEREGYSFIITHAELKAIMSIEQPKTIEEFEKTQLDYCMAIEKIKDALLEDYNLCLASMPGEGYILLHPNDQVRKGVDYYIKKSQKALSRAMSRLANVDSELLNMESQQIQHSKMNRVAFIKSAFRKRKIFQPEKKKQIE